MPTFSLSQVNVFSQAPLGGNPVAVIHAAENLSDEQMFSLARWTNLSETTFLLPPTNPDADYKLRIYSPSGELPFAGHPTLGSCHAWLASGGEPQDSNTIIQECNVGLVSIKKQGSLLEFAAPPLIRTGDLDKATLGKIVEALSISSSDIIEHQWVDNGPGWCAIMLESAQQVLELKPNWSALAPLNLGVVGFHAKDLEEAIEVRALIGDGGYEDPVTGSLNASVAQWLIGAGIVKKSSYIAAQGTILQREGRVHVRQADGEIWIGGDSVEVIRGEISL